MAKRKIKKEVPEADPEFQVAPMVDVLLVLLIFFMSITSTEVLRNVRGIDLAVAKDAKDPQKKTSQVVVNVEWNTETRKGNLVIEDRDFANPQDIRQLLINRVNATPSLRVLIRADKNVEYSYIQEIVKTCALAQISSVTFSVVTGEKK